MSLRNYLEKTSLVAHELQKVYPGSYMWLFFAKIIQVMKLKSKYKNG
jgi:hypothetical protein